MTTNLPIRRTRGKHQHSTDTGWAWIVLGATFTAMFIMLGLVFNIGIYFVSFLNAFQESRSFTSWIGALQAAVFHLSGMLSSFLLPFLGPRWLLMAGALLLSSCYAILYIQQSILYITIIYGSIGGVAASFIVCGSLAAIAKYFDKRMYMASGLTNAGGGLGVMLVGILTEWLVDEYGWRQSLLVLSGVALQVCVASTLVFELHSRKNPKLQGAVSENRQVKTSEEETTHDNDIPIATWDTIQTVSAVVARRLDNTATLPSSDNKEPKTKNVSHHAELCSLLRNKKFWCLTIANLLINMASISTLMFLKDILKFSGCLSNFKIHLTCVGGGSVVGQVVAGILARYMKPPLYFAAVSFICALDVFGLCYPTEEWQFYILNLVFGFCHGQLYVLKILMFAHAFGRDKMASVFGFGMGFGFIICLIGPPLGGWIQDRTDTYNGTITFFAVCFALASVFAFFGYVAQHWKSNRVDSI